MISAGYLISIFLVFVRVGSLMVTAPFFGHAAIPVRVKIPFVLLLAYTIVGMVPGPLPEHVGQPVGLVLAVMIEVGTGLLLGYAAQFVFWMVTHAGDIIGFQVGLSMAEVFNPQEGISTNPIGRALLMTLTLVFLLLDGHHHILRGIVGSFEVVPLGGADLSVGGPLLLDWMAGFFASALRLAAPFMITMFLLDVALGVFARVAPQADLFSMSHILKLFVGLVPTGFFLGQFVPVIPDLVRQMLEDMTAMMEAIAPRR